MTGDLIAKRGLLWALFSNITCSFFLETGLGLGATQHTERVKEGEVGRKVCYTINVAASELDVSVSTATNHTMS